MPRIELFCGLKTAFLGLKNLNQFFGPDCSYLFHMFRQCFVGSEADSE